MSINLSKRKTFDAFQGNSLIKSSSKHSTKSKESLSKLDKYVETYDFDELWRGSVSNLMSSENITEDLIKDSIKELENAMQESKRMLHERDTEIQKLRESVVKLKKEREREEDDKYPSLLNDYKETQTRVMELECQLRELKITHAQKIEQLHGSCSSTQPIGNEKEGCTCACGSACQALVDLNESKKSLEAARTKYDNLKRKVREFRKQIELEQKEEERSSMEGKNMSSCTLQ